jgi:hypothetical protein
MQICNKVKAHRAGITLVVCGSGSPVFDSYWSYVGDKAIIIRTYIPHEKEVMGVVPIPCFPRADNACLVYPPSDSWYELEAKFSLHREPEAKR